MKNKILILDKKKVLLVELFCNFSMFVRIYFLTYSTKLQSSFATKIRRRMFLDRFPMEFPNVNKFVFFQKIKKIKKFINRQ